MKIKTYRARTMAEALDLVRIELGPDAAVLGSREVRGRGPWSWLSRTRDVEVTASSAVNVPVRMPVSSDDRAPAEASPPLPAHLELDYRAKFRHDLKGPAAETGVSVDQFPDPALARAAKDLPDTLFALFTELVEADISETSARQLVDRLQVQPDLVTTSDLQPLRAQLQLMVSDSIQEHGPIHVQPGRPRRVALVGPTGVGKTTTIAKLAADYRLRERLRVGLITVDTYRIAAVEQLRTYADIIDLPIEVVATPREMRGAIERMNDFDLILIDTAGRSPRDEVRIQELKSLLTESEADEVHLVLSSVSSAQSLVTAAQRFAAARATALVLTKLDEATSLGNLLSLLEAVPLPISYLTDGQNVPDDISVAARDRLAAAIFSGHYR